MIKADFLEKAISVHSDKFDYSEVPEDIKNMSKKIWITCRVHSVRFEQTPGNHLDGAECPECAKEKRRRSISMSIDGFKERGNTLFGNLFDYSMVTDIKNSRSMVDLRCNKHLIDFKTRVEYHIRGSNTCPLCIKSVLSVAEFIERAKEKHGDKFDYSMINQSDINNGKVSIICRNHGVFSQKVKHHLSGNGCKKCGLENAASSNAVSEEEFFERAKIKFGDKFEYSRFEYGGFGVESTIICPKHGEFQMSPAKHLGSTGCLLCAKEAKGTKQTVRHFKEKNTAKHGNKYCYSLITGDYLEDSRVNIICPKHGIFKQRVSNHSEGKGCPKCAKTMSKAEIEIAEWIKDQYSQSGKDITIETRNRQILDGLEIDIWLPELSIGIEYHGVYWHQEDSKIEQKANLAQSKGIKLIQIFEDIWNTKKDVVKKRLKHILGLDKFVCGARECAVEEGDRKEVRKFLEETHIQGAGTSLKSFVLRYNESLVAVLTYGKARFGNKNAIEIFRFASSGSIPGAFQKLLKRLRLEFPDMDIVSYADRMWSSGDVYIKAGFTLKRTSGAGYAWYRNKVRYNRQVFQRHKLKDNPLIDPETLHLKTEYEICKANGFMKLMDAGQLCFILSAK